MQLDREESLLSAARACAAQITSYYRVQGHSGVECNISNMLWSPDHPGISIDFVPENARLGIEQMAIEAGIKLKITDGGRGKHAYYNFSEEGLTVDKLENMRQLVQHETDELIKERGRHTKGHDKPAARGYADRESKETGGRHKETRPDPHHPPKPNRGKSGRGH